MKQETKLVPYGADNFQLWIDGAKDLVSIWDIPPNPIGRDQWNRQRDALRTVPRFYGASEPDARNILLNGWPQGASLVEKLAASIADELPPPASRRRVRKWRDDGDELSMERLQAGQENCWRSMHRRLRSACGLVEVVQAWGSGCGASQSQLQWSGAACLALTDLLEKADYSVELALIAGMYGINQVRIDLKQMGELVNLESLAAVAVYPPAWRIYGLCAFQQSPLGSGNGFNSHPHASPFIFAANGMYNYRPNVITLTMSECHNADDAKVAVIAAIKQLEDAVNLDPEANTTD